MGVRTEGHASWSDRFATAFARDGLGITGMLRFLVSIAVPGKTHVDWERPMGEATGSNPASNKPNFILVVLTGVCHQPVRSNSRRTEVDGTLAEVDTRYGVAVDGRAVFEIKDLF